MENAQPKLSHYNRTIPHGSDLTLKLTGEDWGDGIRDTRVEIDAGTLCWVTWDDKLKFLSELQAVIDKYAI